MFLNVLNMQQRDHDVLAALSRRANNSPSSTEPELARKLAIAQSHIHRCLLELADRGFIERRAHARQARVNITAQGRAMLDAADILHPRSKARRN